MLISHFVISKSKRALQSIMFKSRTTCTISSNETDHMTWFKAPPLCQLTLVMMSVCVLCVTVKGCVFVPSLVAPVQSDGDVSLDVSALVLRQVTWQELPPQVDQLHHHVADLVEQIDFVFLMDTEREDREKRGYSQLLFCFNTTWLVKKLSEPSFI